MNLSAVVVNYNHSRFLSGCLDRIIQQSYQPIEIIVIDDASTDDSVEIIKSYQKKHSYIKIHQNPKNLGPHESVAIGVAMAEGEYLSLCAVDDLLFPGIFATYAKIIEKSPEVGLCCSDLAVFYDDLPNKLLTTSLLPFETSKIIQPSEIRNLFWKYNFYIYTHAAIYKKSLVQKYGFVESLKSLADFFLNCQIVFNYPIAYVPEILGAFRIRRNSYGDLIRKNFRIRNEIHNSLLYQIKEKDLSEAFMKSSLLSFGGYFMILFLFFHPQYWNFLPGVIAKKIKQFFFKLRNKPQVLNRNELF